MKKCLALFFLAVLLVSCDAFAVQTPDLSTPTPSLEDLRDELQRNLLKWQAQKITHYKYNLQVGCLCGYPLETIEIKNGELVSIAGPDGIELSTIDSSGKVVFKAQEGGSAELRNYLETPTIENLFTYAGFSMDHFGGFGIEYDPKFSFPTGMGFLYDAYSTPPPTDNGEGVAITNFKVLP